MWRNGHAARLGVADNHFAPFQDSLSCTSILPTVWAANRGRPLLADPQPTTAGSDGTSPGVPAPGLPLQVSFNRIKTSMEVRRTKRMGGHLPSAAKSNSMPVLFRNYLSGDPVITAWAEEVLGEALLDAEQAARQAHERAARAAGGGPRVVPGPAGSAALEASGLAPDTARQVADGDLDTGWTACADHNEHSLTREPCQVTFLDCFHCGNCLVTRDHLPRLLALLDALAQRRRELPEKVWWPRYGPAWVAIRQDILGKFTPAELQHAQAGKPHDALLPRLDALAGTDLEDFQRFLAKSLPAVGARQGARAGVRKFWLWRSALPSGALRFDPKHIDGWSEPAHVACENASARIPEEILGPLFVWAMRFIDEFSADILIADRKWRTPPPPPAGPRVYGQLPVLLRAWLDARIAAGQPLPAWRGKVSTTAIADALGRNRISLARYRHLIDEAAAIAGTAPQTVSDHPVRGRLDGRPWIAVILADHIERDSLAALARLLQDACYLVLAFLSGARDSEIKHVRRGGLTTECDADGAPYRWKMHSLAFKAEDDPAGVPATWNIGEPAAQAIAVLEQLQPPGTEYLFARLEHSPGSKPNAVSQVLTSGATNARLNAFAAWVNDYCQQQHHAHRPAREPLAGKIRQGRR